MYYHKFLTHRYVQFSPALIVSTKLILWMTKRYDALDEKIWVLRHKKHHRATSVNEDPSGPYNIFKFENNRTFYTIDEINASDKSTTYKNLDCFLEKTTIIGRAISLILCYVFLGMYGVLFWVVLQSTAKIIVFGHGLSHMFGYTHGVLPNGVTAKNILPIGLVLAGEELHWNHHKWPNRLNLSSRWYEIDTGYWLIRLLSLFKLLKIISK